MLPRLNTTTLFCAGLFLAVMLFASGFLPQFDTFIHVWVVELPSAVFFAVCCIYLVIRPPEGLSLTRDELRFVVAPITALILWSALSALWAISWKSSIHYSLVWSTYLIFYLIIREMIKTESGLRRVGITLVTPIVIFAVGAVAGYASFVIFGGANELGRLAKLGEQAVTILPLLLVAVVRLNGKSLRIRRPYTR